MCVCVDVEAAYWNEWLLVCVLMCSFLCICECLLLCCSGGRSTECVVCYSIQYSINLSLTDTMTECNGICEWLDTVDNIDLCSK